MKLTSGADKKESNKKKQIRIICCVLAAICFLIAVVVPIIVYELSFGVVYAPSEACAESFAEAEHISVIDEIYSNDDVWIWNRNGENGIIIFAHGFGGGYRPYGDMLKAYADMGFCVITYGAKGHGEANELGESDVGGLPNGTFDMFGILRWVRLHSSENSPWRDKPIYLLGHSWGGYCTGMTLRYGPDVAGVCIMSGFNTSEEMLRWSAERISTCLAPIWTPVLFLWERIRCYDADMEIFGLGFMRHTVIDSFEGTDMPVLIIHGTQDDVVPMSCGYDQWKEQYATSDRMKFVELDGRGHNDVFMKDGQLDMDLLQLIAEFFIEGK